MSPRLILALLVLLCCPPPAAADQPRPIRLLFTGDNLLGGRMDTLLRTHGPAYPYAHVAPLLAGADFAFGNLECPLTTALVPTAGKSVESLEAKREFLFKADPVLGGQALAMAGFDLVSVANNHAMDYQAVGMEETLRTLDRLQIRAAGGGYTWNQATSPRIVTLQGIRIGVLACSMVNPIGSAALPDRAGMYTAPKCWTPFLKSQVEALDRKTGLVVFTVHWGTEATPVPEPYQVKIAEAAIEAGADLVIGHHPHVLQPVRRHRGGVIAYSLGNFCFTGKAHKLPSAMLEATVDESGLRDIRLYPILVEHGRPRWTGDHGTVTLLDRLAPGIERVLP